MYGVVGWGELREGGGWCGEGAKSVSLTSCLYEVYTFKNVIYLFCLVLLLNTLVRITIIRAGLGGSIGCAVRLETRRSRVQPPPRSATFFRGD